MTHWPRTLAAIAPLALVGCAQLPAIPLHGDALLEHTRSAFDIRPQPVDLAPAARPALQRGDTFVFGRTTLTRVAAASAHTLTWTQPDGRKLRATRDFFAPALAADYPGRRVTSTIEGDPSALWPLAAGKTVRFEETRRTTWDETGHVEQTRRRWGMHGGRRARQLRAGRRLRNRGICAAAHTRRISRSRCRPSPGTTHLHSGTTCAAPGSRGGASAR